MTVVHTIGYEGADIEAFVAALQRAGISILADVRAVPLSRKKGFSKNKLRERLTAAGIEYVHLRELGDPKPGREAAKAGRMAQFQRIYRGHLSTPPAQQALQHLASLADSAPTCMMCFERDPTFCHRSIIAAQLCERGSLVLNLFVGPQPEHGYNTARKQSGHSGQGASAA